MGRCFKLEPGVTLVGRRDTPDETDPEGSRRWVLTDPAVSRTHARIDWDGKGAPVLLHLSSTNATLLEGRIVTGESQDEGQTLQAGQNLRMGQTGFEIETGEDTTRWYFTSGEDGENDLPPGETVSLDGVSLCCEGQVLEVTLGDPEVEAYLLRRIEEQFWTTSLKASQSVALRNSDVIRTPEQKLTVHDREAR